MTDEALEYLRKEIKMEEGRNAVDEWFIKEYAMEQEQETLKTLKNLNWMASAS